MCTVLTDHMWKVGREIESLKVPEFNSSELFKV